MYDVAIIGSGCYADKIAELLGDKFFEIIPRSQPALILSARHSDKIADQ